MTALLVIGGLIIVCLMVYVGVVHDGSYDYSKWFKGDDNE